MTTKQATAKLLDAALTWHAERILAGQRQTHADQRMHRAACRYLRAKNSPRKR